MNPAYKFTCEIWKKGKLIFNDPYNTTPEGAIKSFEDNILYFPGASFACAYGDGWRVNLLSL